MLRTLLLVFVSLAITHVSHGQDASDVPANDIAQATEQSVELNTTTGLAPVETTVTESNEQPSNRAIDQILRNTRPAASSLSTTLSAEQREDLMRRSRQWIQADLDSAGDSFHTADASEEVNQQSNYQLSESMRQNLRIQARDWVRADLNSAPLPDAQFHSMDASEDVGEQYTQQTTTQLSEAQRQELRNQARDWVRADLNSAPMEDAKFHSMDASEDIGEQYTQQTTTQLSEAQRQDLLRRARVWVRADLDSAPMEDAKFHSLDASEEVNAYNYEYNNNAAAQLSSRQRQDMLRQARDWEHVHLITTDTEPFNTQSANEDEEFEITQFGYPGFGGGYGYGPYGGYGGYGPGFGYGLGGIGGGIGAGIALGVAGGLAGFGI